METIVVALNWAEKGILGLLILLSVWSIGIMIERRRAFKKHVDPSEAAEAEKKILEGAREALKSSPEDQTLVPSLLTCLSTAPVQTVDAVEPAFRNWQYKQRAFLEKNLGVLATLGANAPFIGLLGTVFGIIEAFSELSNQEAGSNAVMASIAEALIATAMGLFVAIPAVMAYNHFSQKLKAALGTAEAIKNLYLSRLTLFQK